MVDERPKAERLVAFTDAVVAIAITLLVLPLVDEFATAPASGSGQAVLAHALDRHTGQLIAFGLSFALIARMWWWHHGTFRHMRHVTVPIATLDLAWLFTIVALPLPTVIVAAWDTSALSFGFYAGDLLLGAVLLTVIALIHYRDLRRSDAHDRFRRGLIASFATVLIFGLALVVGLVGEPWWGYSCYWLLALTGPVVVLINRRLSQRDARRSTVG